jgi:hypothetical protein
MAPILLTDDCDEFAWLFWPSLSLRNACWCQRLQTIRCILQCLLAEPMLKIKPEEKNSRQELKRTLQSPV